MLGRHIAVAATATLSAFRWTKHNTKLLLPRQMQRAGVVGMKKEGGGREGWDLGGGPPLQRERDNETLKCEVVRTAV